MSIIRVAPANFELFMTVTVVKCSLIGLITVVNITATNATYYSRFITSLTQVNIFLKMALYSLQKDSLVLHMRINSQRHQINLL
jgi:hypothetical protein